MNTVAPTASPPAGSNRRRLFLACLLFVAQLFSQLHALEHVDSADHDDHDGEVCLLCILGAASDHADTDSFTAAIGPAGTVHPVPVFSEGCSSPSPIGYQGRAPPCPSSFA